MTEEHTLKHVRTHSQPEFIDRGGMEKWKAAGATDSYTKAAEKTRDILQNHKPEPLPDKVLADIQAVIAETEEELEASK
jgi:trimethylamine--corrinoid protein Co-methyltransferase